MWVPELWYLQTYRTCYNVFWAQCYFVLSINKGWSATCRDCKYGSVSKYHRVSGFLSSMYRRKLWTLTMKFLFVWHHSTAKLLFLARVLFSELLNGGVLSTCWVVHHLANPVQKMWRVFVVLLFDFFKVVVFFLICFIYFSEKGKAKGSIFSPHI